MACTLLALKRQMSRVWAALLTVWALAASVTRLYLLITVLNEDWRLIACECAGGLCGITSAVMSFFTTEDRLYECKVEE